MNKPIAERRTAQAQAGRWRMLGGAATAVMMTFNLVCTGTVTTTSYNDRKSAPYNYVYRIDLSKSRWCDGECKSINEVASVQPASITLKDKKEDGPFSKSSTRNVINRETGEHSILHVRRLSATPFSMEWQGTCTPSPFTGFPDFKTKF
ncbi:hypothetical protein [Sphingomonas sanxanigenens]|uniref:hypothetical protein n=1 Tax=Sphingomonas sanxanigenens TaxID=397260 RepID=UPI001301570F|nr:hypothetical protein [Sphingomonas sanxanigenens]